MIMNALNTMPFSMCMYIHACASIYLYWHMAIKNILNVNDQNSTENIILRMWMSAMHFMPKWNHQEAFWLDSTLPLKPTSSGYSGLPQTVMATVGYYRQWWLQWATTDSDGYSGLPQTVMATVGYHRQWWLQWATTDSDGYSGLPQTMMATVGYHRQWWLPQIVMATVGYHRQWWLQQATTDSDGYSGLPQSWLQWATTDSDGYNGLPQWWL